MRKLGPHCQRSTPQAADWARRAWIVKSMDDVGLLRIARPGAITIFRRYIQYQDTYRNGAEVAAEIVASLGGFRPTYVELYNEHEATVATLLVNHARFTAEATEYLHARGIKVLGFSFNQGAPEHSDWEFLKAHNYAGVDAIGLHQYWAAQGFSEWRGLRHRKVHEWTGGQHPPFIISECGRDRVIEEGATGRGWRQQGISAEQYEAELAAYDAELCKDDYVIGGTVFTAGPFNDWDDFSTDGISHTFTYGDTPLAVPNSQVILDSSTEEEQMPNSFEYVLGFLSYFQAHPEIGQPTSGLMYDANGTAVQYTEKGKLEWNKASNQTLFFAAAR